MAELPDLYFRIRENGAAVFRVDTDNRHRRLELEQIATVNIRSGEARPLGNATLTEAERARIELWLRERQAVVARREVEDIWRAIDHLNLTCQWAQSKARPEDLEAVTDALLLAMHDLRAVLVKKKADRLDKAGD